MTATDDAPDSPALPRKRLSDETAYLLPMGTFLALTWVGGQWPSLYPILYVLKTVVVAVLLIVLWRHFTPISWAHWKLGVVVGVIGIVQWVGMEKLLLWAWPNYPRVQADPFIPTEVLTDPWMLYGFIAVRWAGATLLVPVMEELFWRDWLWRTVIAPNDFKLAGIGEWEAKAFWVVALVFATVHLNWWITSIAWAVLVGLLLARTKSLGACIIAHAVTNFLLGAYVLWTGDWAFW